MNDISKFIPEEMKRRSTGEPVNFFKAYCEAIVKVLRLTDGELKLFLALCIKAEYNTNMVKVDAEFKQWFEEASGLSDKTVKNALLSLDKKGIIRKVNRDSRDGVYILNKDYVFRGSLWERADSISFTQTHHKDGSITYHVHIDVELKKEAPKDDKYEQDDNPFPEEDDSKVEPILL